mmetsp:Transcript_18675/g.38659  ORF Transcript_18675/g.38659 Transcript_18675/m.38659 type:complete len:277 (+) Transcript_18675:207-1037(+)|eukprot:CAMPEP_0171343030 /NCGR_PEP_ID=MMETSP0878-20121228/16095_1 /TAXON_ID=67004 /ORGANISM="Thalassiosira weissflogii, Strain CCMP1336" /LENGTH=276 /DNA_ID=CAMNT_0011845879 /DNA_START=58 /DNA_END=888 /DNA_ORIENTATION=-
MINVREKSTTSRENRSMSFPKRILVDIVVLSVFVIVFVEFYNPNNSPLPLQISQQPKRILLDQEIELNWERQHVDDLQQTLRGVSESQAALVQLNVRMERKLKEMELKLEYEENELLKAQLQALVRSNLADVPAARGGGGVEASQKNLRGGGAFRNGDVVQIRGTASAAPWKIQRCNEDGTYDLIRATDGEVTSSVRQDILSLYKPYDIGSEALCNIGSYGSGHAEFVPCSILHYSPRSSEGPVVLQGKYKVRIYNREGELDREATLPLWKVTKSP